MDFFDTGEGAEGGGAGEEGEDGLATGGAEGAVFVVGRTVVPGAEAGRGGAGERAGGVVCVEEG